MKIQIIKTNKKTYIEPHVELIKLDTDISLTLDSLNPPDGPGERMNRAPEYFNNDPYKGNRT